jgi:16S rRNA (cytosine967-C5)-methyltransferase
LSARGVALGLIASVLDQRRAFESIIEEPATARALGALAERDRAYAFALARTTLRHLGQIEDLLSGFLDKPLPARAGATPHILRLGLADLLFLNTESYAAVNSAVDLAASDDKARHFRGLVNAVLRRATREGRARLEEQDVSAVLLPAWLSDGWRRTYGEAKADEIIAAHLEEPPLDLTLRPGLDAGEWAAKLEADILPTGSLHRKRSGNVQSLPGYAEGAWWVQDAGAALPARLFGDVRGRAIVDLAAAPGGKTLWLAAAGANVIAVDKAPDRLQRVKENLARLDLTAELVAADGRDYRPQTPAAGVLLDAPCSATGTIRRHPDLPWIKDASDIRPLSLLQAELIAAAFAMLEPGGTLVYSVCSLEPEEGPEVVEAFLRDTPSAQRSPIAVDEIAGINTLLTTEGDLRTLPCDWRALGGIDGFYAARIVRGGEGA